MKVGDLVKSKYIPSGFHLGVVTGIADSGKHCWVNFMNVGYDKWFRCETLEIIDPVSLISIVNTIIEEPKKNDFDCGWRYDE